MKTIVYLKNKFIFDHVVFASCVATSVAVLPLATVTRTVSVEPGFGELS